MMPGGVIWVTPEVAAVVAVSGTAALPACTTPAEA